MLSVPKFSSKKTTPQCLQPLCHPSNFSPRTERIQGTIQVSLSFQMDGFLTGPSQQKGKTEHMKWNGSCKWLPKTSFIGRLFSDRCKIPQNLPTNFQSDLIATIQHRLKVSVFCPTRNFSSILGRPHFSAVRSTFFWPKKRPRVLKFYSTENFGFFFWAALLKMSGFAPY